jgi:hypothetical protein
MKLKNSITAISALILISWILHSCKPKKNECDNCENELITTFNVALTDSATGAVTHFIFRDLDGDGANAPVQFDTIKVLANHTYTASFFILDESKTPADTTSNEIRNEQNDHLFFFTAVPASSIAVTITDYDTHSPPLPVGLDSKWHTGAASSGTLQIVLRHQPGVKNGTYAPGDTDLDITFQTKIE